MTVFQLVSQLLSSITNFRILERVWTAACCWSDEHLEDKLGSHTLLVFLNLFLTGNDICQLPSSHHSQ